MEEKSARSGEKKPGFYDHLALRTKMKLSNQVADYAKINITLNGFKGYATRI